MVRRIDLYLSPVLLGGGTGVRRWLCFPRTLPVPLPIHAYHDDRDEIVPYHCSVEMVEAVNQRGGDATLITCEGWGHNSWDYAYEMSDLVEWLVLQKRK